MAASPRDPSVLERFAPMYSSLVSDCAENRGLDVVALPGSLDPFHADPLRVVVGWAYPALTRRTRLRVDIDGLLEMVDATPPDSIAVVAADGDLECAMWGGLMAASSQAKGSRGAVLDGPVRDVAQIAALGYPVWARGRTPKDIRGRGEMVAWGTPVRFGGVLVSPGDLVFADANGVVVLPSDSVLDVLAACEERVQAEAVTEEELKAGATPAEVYARHKAF